MNADLLTALQTAWPQLQKLGVVHLGVFGSEARGQATPDSALDVLVHLKQPSLRVLVEVKVSSRASCTVGPEPVADGPGLGLGVLHATDAGGELKNTDK